MCKEDIRNAKKIMAFEVTKLVHGEEEALKVKKASEEIFSNKGNSDNTETIEISQDVIVQGINVIEILMLSNLFILILLLAKAQISWSISTQVMSI